MKTKKAIIFTVILAVVLVFCLAACDGNDTPTTVTVNGIEINTSDVKTALSIGEDLDLSKLVVEVVNSDNTKIALTVADFTIDNGGFDKTKAGDYTITVKYGEYTKTFKVTVAAATTAEATVSSIAIKAGSTHKTSFAYEEDFSAANLVIVATMSDATTKDVSTGYAVNSTAYNKAHNLFTAQTYEITVTYQTKTVKYNVTVAAKPVVLESIAVKEGSTHKTTFNYGEAFSAANLAIILTYNDESTEEITTGYNVNSYNYVAVHNNSSTVQTYSIGVSYEGKQTSYNVNVKKAEISNISIVNPANKTSFDYGEAFSTDGLTAKLVYVGGYEIALTKADIFGATNFVVDASDFVDKAMDEYGHQCDIYVRYNESISTTYKVDVAKKPIMIGIRLNPSSTHKTTFTGDTEGAGEEFSYAGIAVQGVMDNGTYTELSLDDCSISCDSYDNSSAGFYTVNVQYIPEGLYTDYQIEVVIGGITITGISIAARPEEVYFVGDEFSYIGYIISVTYNDMSTSSIVLPNAGVSISGFDSSVANDSQEVTFTFATYEATTTVMIIEDSIVGIGFPAVDFNEGEDIRKTFYLNEDFDITSWTPFIVAYYASGKQELLNENEYSVDTTNYDKTVAGHENSIKIKLNSDETKFFDVGYITVLDQEKQMGLTYVNISGPASIESPEEIDETHWSIIANKEGRYCFEFSVKVNYYDSAVMLGEWTSPSNFIVLSKTNGEYGENYYFDYDKTQTVFTIKITYLDDTVSYVYVTITPPIPLITNFKINGDKVEVMDSRYEYSLKKNISSYNFTFDYDESKYTLEISDMKQAEQTYPLSYGDFESFTIIVKDKNSGEEKNSYDVNIAGYVPIVSVKFNDSDMTFADGRFELRLGTYNYSGDNTFAVITDEGYKAEILYNEVVLLNNIINGSKLFYGSNNFDIYIYDNDDQYIANVSLRIEIATDGLLIAGSFGEYSVEQTNYLFISNPDMSEANLTSGTYNLTINDIAGVTFSIKNSSWINGQGLTIVKGRNAFVLLVTKDSQTYQFNLVVYCETIQKNEYDLGINIITVGGHEVSQNSYNTSRDVYCVVVPNGYITETNVGDKVDVELQNESSDYDFGYSYADGMITITATSKENTEIVYYLYVELVIDGETNNNVTASIYAVSLETLWFNESEIDNLVPAVTFNEGTTYMGELEINANGVFLVDYPNYATIDYTFDSKKLVFETESNFFHIMAAPGDTFIFEFTVTSSDNLSTRNYSVTINVGEEKENLATISVGSVIKNVYIGIVNVVEPNIVDFVMGDSRIEGAYDITSEEKTISIQLASDYVDFVFGVDRTPIEKGTVVNLPIKEMEEGLGYCSEEIYVISDNETIATYVIVIRRIIANITLSTTHETLPLTFNETGLPQLRISSEQYNANKDADGNLLVDFDGSAGGITYKVSESETRAEVDGIALPVAKNMTHITLYLEMDPANIYIFIEDTDVGLFDLQFGFVPFSHWFTQYGYTDDGNGIFSYNEATGDMVYDIPAFEFSPYAADAATHSLKLAVFNVRENWNVFYYNGTGYVKATDTNILVGVQGESETNMSFTFKLCDEDTLDDVNATVFTYCFNFSIEY